LRLYCDYFLFLESIGESVKEKMGSGKREIYEVVKSDATVETVCHRPIIVIASKG
jgi:hypothetical protein